MNISPPGIASSAMHKSSPEKESAEHEWLSEILKYLEFHICEKLTVRDICNAFPCPVLLVQSLFHEQLNCGVIDHFNKMKIAKSERYYLRRIHESYRECIFSFLQLSSIFFQTIPDRHRDVTVCLCIFIKGITAALRKAKNGNARFIKRCNNEVQYCAPRCATFLLDHFYFQVVLNLKFCL